MTVNLSAAFEAQKKSTKAKSEPKSWAISAVQVSDGKVYVKAGANGGEERVYQMFGLGEALGIYLAGKVKGKAAKAAAASTAIAMPEDGESF